MVNYDKMEKSKPDIKRDNSKQEEDSDQPKQNKELVPNRGATSDAQKVRHRPENVLCELSD